MQDFYLRADTLPGLLADMDQLGLLADGGFIDASHSHALAYIGELPGAPGVHLNLCTLTDELAQAVLTANFAHTTLVQPESPSCAWAK